MWTAILLIPCERRNACNKRFRKMCKHPSPTACKRCSEPDSHFLCMLCCSIKTLLTQVTISLLELANKNVDEACTGNMGTDSGECIRVVSAVTARTRHPTVQHAMKLSVPKQLMNNTPLDTDGQAATARSSSNVDAATDGRWLTRKHRRKGNIVKNSARSVVKSFMDSHFALHITPSKSQNKTTLNPIIDGKSLASSNIVVGHSLDFHDPVTRKTNDKMSAVSR